MKDIQEAIIKQAALDFVNKMPDEQKQAVIAAAVEDILKNLRLDYEMKNLLTAQAMVIAKEYIASPQVQSKLEKAVIQATADVLSGIQKALGKGLEDTIKSKYSRILSDPPYGGD